MKKTIKILLMISVLFSMASGLFGPIYAVFVEQIGGDLLDAGGAYAAFSISTGILLLVMSKWEDRMKHQEKMVVLGYFLNCLGFVGYIFVSNPLELFIVQIVFGISTAIATPAYDGLYSKYCEKNHLTWTWGLWETSYFIVVGVAAFLGGAIAQFWGFKALFQIMLVISLMGLVVSFDLLRRVRKHGHLLGRVMKHG